MRLYKTTMATDSGADSTKSGGTSSTKSDDESCNEGSSAPTLCDIPVPHFLSQIDSRPNLTKSFGAPPSGIIVPVRKPYSIVTGGVHLPSAIVPPSSQGVSQAQHRGSKQSDAIARHGRVHGYPWSQETKKAWRQDMEATHYTQRQWKEEKESSGQRWH